MMVERTAERTAERKTLAQRRRRLIFNNDGDDLFSMRPDEHDSAAEALLRERTTALWGSQVDSIWYYSTHGIAGCTTRAARSAACTAAPIPTAPPPPTTAACWPRAPTPWR